MPIDRIEEAIPRIKLSNTASLKCAKAIMTSDTFRRKSPYASRLRKASFTSAAIAKGAGMIDPNMATMLSVITTDAKVSQSDLKKVLGGAVEDSFNRITIDGDMSTNDTVIALANGASKVRPTLTLLREAFDAVAQTLARMIVKDGEGVTKFVEIALTGQPARMMLAKPPRPSPTPLSSNVPGPEAIRTGAASWMPWATRARNSWRKKSPSITRICRSSVAVWLPILPGRRFRPWPLARNFASASTSGSASFPTPCGRPT